MTEDARRPPLSGLQDWLAAREAAVPDLRPGCAARLHWAGGSDGARRQALALVYVHGFSASPAELSPAPERVAAALGANLYMPRIAGHGRDGAALAAATLADWRRDVAEALSIGRDLGERVILWGNSTGATLIALAAAADPGALAGLVMTAPNFGLRDRKAERMMALPGAALWAPWLVGRERVFDVISPEHGRIWTTRYPTRAVLAVGHAVAAARRTDVTGLLAPLFIALTEADQVIDPAAADAFAMRWGGPVTRHAMIMGPDDDARGHLLAGDVFSPGQTDGLVAAIGNWAQASGLGG